MQPLEEKDSSPLEDTEITRLIKVSRELGYKKQDKIPERNLVSFKPTSITQIATSSDHQTKEPIDASENYDLTKPVKKKNLTENKQGSGENLPGDMLNSEPVETEPNSRNTPEQKEINNPIDKSSTSGSGILESQPVSEKIVGEDTSKEKGSEPDSAQVTSSEKDLDKDSPILSTQDGSSSVEEAKQAGIEIGKKIAFGDFEKKQQEALQAFQIIIDNIKKKEAVDKTDLTHSILRVITRLASERAGSVIDEHPETFKNKIISFADKIEQESKNLILNLNPMDAHLLKKKLAESLSDKKIEIRENSELFRGDFIFQAGAVEIGDLISEQIQIVEKEKTATTHESEPEIDNNTIEKKEVGSDDKGSSKQTGKGNLSEINNDK